MQGELKKCEILLASGSPRRKELLSVLGIPFRVVEASHGHETYPEHLKAGDIALYLAEQKSLAYAGIIGENQILLTADTIVWHHGRELGKPSGDGEARSMLAKLSGSTHQVYTGVWLRSTCEGKGFLVSTDVTFSRLTAQEITHYVEHYRPFDKAGSYGIQEWIGHIGVERIQGSYFNVMGLPVQRVYSEIKSMIG